MNGQTFTVADGGSFTVAGSFVANSDVAFGDGQSIFFHTSCSVPLNQGDQYGPLTLMSATDSNGAAVPCSAPGTSSGAGKKGKKGKKDGKKSRGVHNQKGGKSSSKRGSLLAGQAGNSASPVSVVGFGTLSALVIVVAAMLSFKTRRSETLETTNLEELPASTQTDIRQADASRPLLLRP